MEGNVIKLYNIIILYNSLHRYSAVHMCLMLQSYIVTLLHCYISPCPHPTILKRSTFIVPTNSARFEGIVRRSQPLGQRMFNVTSLPR